MQVPELLREWISQNGDNPIDAAVLQFLIDTYKEDRRSYTASGRLNLKGVSFQNTDLSSIDLRSIELEGVTFENTIVGRSNFIFMLSYGNSYDLSFKGINLMGQDLTQIDFSNCRVKDLDLNGAFMQIISLSSISDHVRKGRASLKGANFSGMKAKGSFCVDPLYGVESYIFEDLSDLDFSNANLDDVELYGINLSKCNFTKATFKNAKIIACNCTDSDFNGADFTNAELSHSNFQSARFHNAIFRESIV